MAGDNAPGNTPYSRTERRPDALEQLLLPPCADDERIRPIERDHTFDRVRNLARDEFDNDGELVPAVFELGILLLDEPHQVLRFFTEMVVWFTCGSAISVRSVGKEKVKCNRAIFLFFWRRAQSTHVMHFSRMTQTDILLAEFSNALSKDFVSHRILVVS